MTDLQHVELSDLLHSVRGAVVLSGYDCDLYKSLYGDWHRVERATHGDGAVDRVEVIWLNNRASRYTQGSLQMEF